MVELVAELKVWDIGHQLFDLAKVFGLLAAGPSAGFLVSVARQECDFDRLPSRELFPRPKVRCGSMASSRSSAGIETSGAATSAAAGLSRPQCRRT
jgi:hypothetical protein